METQLITRIVNLFEAIIDQKIQNLQEKFQKKLDLQDGIIKLILDKVNDKQQNNILQQQRRRSKHSTTEVDLGSYCCVCNKIIIRSNIIETKCHHFYHQECLQQKIKQQIDMGFPTITCVGKKPISGKLCYGKIKIQEAQLVNQEYFINKTLLHQAEKLMFSFTNCPTPNCNYFFKCEASLNLCQSCNKWFCYGCLSRCDQKHKCGLEVKKQLICKYCSNCNTLNICQNFKSQCICSQCKNMVLF